MIATMPAFRLAIAAAVLSIAYALLHVALVLRPESTAEDSRIVLLVHSGLGVAAAVVFLRFQNPAILGSLCFISMAMAASAVMTGPELSEISAMRAARAGGAALIGVLAIALAARSTRRARFAHGIGRPRPDGRLSTSTAEPFRIDPNSEPQRLLALASLRRRLIERTLNLTGPEAATAAYSLEARLSGNLAQLDAQSSERATAEHQLLSKSD